MINKIGDNQILQNAKIPTAQTKVETVSKNKTSDEKITTKNNFDEIQTYDKNGKTNNPKKVITLEKDTDPHMEKMAKAIEELKAINKEERDYKFSKLREYLQLPFEESVEKSQNF